MATHITNASEYMSWDTREEVPACVGFTFTVKEFYRDRMEYLNEHWEVNRIPRVSGGTQICPVCGDIWAGWSRLIKRSH